MLTDSTKSCTWYLVTDLIWPRDRHHGVVDRVCACRAEGQFDLMAASYQKKLHGGMCCCLAWSVRMPTQFVWYTPIYQLTITLSLTLYTSLIFFVDGNGHNWLTRIHDSMYLQPKGITSWEHGEWCFFIFHCTEYKTERESLEDDSRSESPTWLTPITNTVGVSYERELGTFWGINWALQRFQRTGFQGFWLLIRNTPCSSSLMRFKSVWSWPSIWEKGNYEWVLASSPWAKDETFNISSDLVMWWIRISRFKRISTVELPPERSDL